MADEIDLATEQQEATLAAAIQAAARDIPKGLPGDCDYCGEWSGRLIGSACATCRTKYKLP